MNGQIIDIGTALRPNPDGTTEGTLSIKSDSNGNCFDVLVWKTDPKPTQREAMAAVIEHAKTIKRDIEMYIALREKDLERL